MVAFLITLLYFVMKFLIFMVISGTIFWLCTLYFMRPDRKFEYVEYLVYCWAFWPLYAIAIVINYIVKKYDNK